MKKICFLLFVLLCVWNQNNSAAQSNLESAIRTLAKDPVLQYGSMSISVFDVKSGQLIASHEPNKSLVPASSLKALTTATALSILGEDYQFRTTLEYDGSISSNGTLEGNVYIKGYGDPSLGSSNVEGSAGFEAVIEQFRLAIQQQGIRKINGAIIGDATFFDEQIAPSSWQYADLGNYYGAGAWGLNIHENLYYLKFRQNSRIGTTPKVASVEPEVEGLNFINHVKTASSGSGDNAYIYGGPYSNDRIVRGTIPAGSGLFTIKGALPNPALFAAFHLEAALQEVGIVTAKPATTAIKASSEKRSIIYTHKSPVLSKIVDRTNLKSVNLFAEGLLKMIGKTQLKVGSISKGTKAIEEFWEAKGLNTKGCFIEDGSGLSRKNAITTYFLGQMLLKMEQDPKVSDTFRESLPIAGKTGTLKYRMRGTTAEGRLFAKTGSISRVRSYTGFAKSRSTGKLLAFSFIVNDYTCSGSQIRQRMEKILVALCR